MSHRPDVYRKRSSNSTALNSKLFSSYSIIYQLDSQTEKWNGILMWLRPEDSFVDIVWRRGRFGCTKGVFEVWQRIAARPLQDKNLAVESPEIDRDKSRDNSCLHIVRTELSAIDLFERGSSSLRRLWQVRRLMSADHDSWKRYAQLISLGG